MPPVGDSTCPSWDNLTNQVEETLAEQTAGISSHPLREEGRGRPRGTATAAPWSDAGSTECPLLEFSELHTWDTPVPVHLTPQQKAVKGTSLSWSQLAP